VAFIYPKQKSDLSIQVVNLTLTPNGQNRQKKQSEGSVLKIQYHIVKNTLLQLTAFSAILPTGQ